MKLLNLPKKSLGQNFLIDKNIISKIVKIGNIDKNKVVLEIGPGYGNLTDEIYTNNPKQVFAVEKDKKIAKFLEKKYENFINIKVLNNDILNIINNNFFKKNITVFGNLPYNISTKILTSLIALEKWPPWYDSLIFMFQKEVADRIIAKSQTKEFNRLSVISNWRLEIKKHFNISKNCFNPKPKIDSTLLSFVPKKNIKYNLKNPKTLEKITRILFSNRRKMINKNFKSLFRNRLDINNKLKINLNKRPEELSLENFWRIAYEYEKLF